MLEDDFGIELAGTNTRAGSFGMMYRTGPKSYADFGIAFYGTKDRRTQFGETIAVSYSVRSVEATVHRVLTRGLTIYSAFGMAIVKDERKLGSLTDIEDEITAWPSSIGLRLIVSDIQSGGFTSFVDARFRWLTLQYSNSITRNKSDFQLGGPFLQLGLMYRR